MPPLSLMRNALPLIVGEVLFDQFPDGRTILGGAPFNVAWNLQGFGRRPTFISAIGNDKNGHQITQLMSKWGMHAEGIQTTDQYATGTVAVTLERGQPSYEIVHPVAYDFIQPPSSSIDLKSFSIFYHGSLAMRSERSRQTIVELIEFANQTESLLRFVDINIREPWFDAAQLPLLIRHADYVKLNEQELSDLTNLPCQSQKEIQKALEVMRKQFGDATYLVTSGPKGAYYSKKDQLLFAKAPNVRNLIDTVGAGDAFAAACIDGLMGDVQPQKLIDRAVLFAARICGIHGATTEDMDIYQL